MIQHGKRNISKEIAQCTTKIWLGINKSIIKKEMNTTQTPLRIIGEKEPILLNFILPISLYKKTKYF